MKKNIIWTLVAMIAFVSSIALPYLEGRSNDWWSIPPLLPADLLPSLALLIACIALLVSWIRSFFPPAQPKPPVLFSSPDDTVLLAPPVRLGKRHWVAKGLLFLVSALLLVGRFRFLPAPGEFFHRGFNDYAKTVLTPEEWRQIARYAQAHPIHVKEEPGVAIDSPSPEDVDALHAALRSATPFWKLDRHTRIQANDDTVDFYWGGALVGHRHVLVMTYPGGEKGDTKLVAEDIVTYMDD